MCDLYVNNLSNHITGADLRAAFGRYGTVHETHVATDSHRRSQGFGFVRMGDGAERAAEALNGADLQGRTVAVGVVRTIEARGGAARGR